MPKWKQWQARKKAPFPQEENEYKKDDEMQQEFIGKVIMPTIIDDKANLKDNASLPSTTNVLKGMWWLYFYRFNSNETENSDSKGNTEERKSISETMITGKN